MLDSMIFFTITMSSVFNSNWALFNAKEAWYYDRIDSKTQYVFNAELCIQKSFDHGYVYGSGYSEICSYRKKKVLYMSPNRALFGIEGGVSSCGFTLFIKHVCMHPITPYINYPVDKIEGAFDQIGIRFSNR